jgi:hypothetical protein
VLALALQPTAETGLVAVRLGLTSLQILLHPAILTARHQMVALVRRALRRDRVVLQLVLSGYSNGRALQVVVVFLAALALVLVVAAVVDLLAKIAMTETPVSVVR